MSTKPLLLLLYRAIMYFFYYDLTIHVTRFLSDNGTSGDCRLACNERPGQVLIIAIWKSQLPVLFAFS